jgi:hypothetical protein
MRSFDVLFRMTKSTFPQKFSFILFFSHFYPKTPGLSFKDTFNYSAVVDKFVRKEYFSQISFMGSSEYFFVRKSPRGCKSKNQHSGNLPAVL